MQLCKCENVEWLETIFGLVIFVGILFSMKDKAILLFEQIEWYKALAVTLGGIAVTGSIALICSFAAKWVTEHIIFVILAASILWIVRYAIL